MVKNLILSIAKDYPYREIEPFLKTLKQTNFNGDFVLFCSNLSRNTIKKLNQLGVKTIEFNDKEFRQKDIHIVHYRFSLFYKFLKRHISEYNQILIADIRDIVFQSNPFKYKNYGKLNFFLEGTKIKDSGVNSLILKEAAGSKFFEKNKDNLISCAGTTIGGSKTILQYLKEMDSASKSGDPIDQGVHNFFLYSKKIKGSKSFENFYGPVLTISGMKNKDLIYNDKNQIIGRNGGIISIIHQYDRIPELVKKFNAPKNYVIKTFDSNYIKFKRSVKKNLFSLPFLGEFFKKKYPDPYLNLV